MNKIQYSPTRKSNEFSLLKFLYFSIFLFVLLIVFILAMVFAGAYIYSKINNKPKEFKIAIRMSLLISIFIISTAFACHVYPILHTQTLSYFIGWTTLAFFVTASLFTKILFAAYVRIETTETDKHYKEYNALNENTQPFITQRIH